MKLIYTTCNGDRDSAEMALNLCLSIKANNRAIPVALVCSAPIHIEVRPLINHFFDYIYEVGSKELLAAHDWHYIPDGTILLPNKNPYGVIFSHVAINRYDKSYILHYYDLLRLEQKNRNPSHLVAWYNELGEYYRVAMGVDRLYQFVTKVDKGERPIRLYWHIACMNHYEEVVREQWDLIVKSGLYDACDTIVVNYMRESVSDIITPFNSFKSKDKISVHLNAGLDNYEFPTLRNLKSDADELDPFYGIYIHTKGVSYADKEVGRHWRDYLNYYIIEHWKDCYDKVRYGHDLCGVKLLTAGAFPMHYSGNFWHFDSEYIRTLVPIETLDKKNRYNAEMWVCSGEPVAASLCNLMIDHFNKPPFK